ncbi:hypothetical protein CYMTET_20671 [Cymbomonas tetramitiformis]|uniref:BTB domain-containing protein n=1 Tax=Cymbomonas tetramitiformis TaxID=36881 RepID=A0AAE0G3V1_9CHLO|nr:hypothetical protein CYMTET_20671 [Cymbomonas tetramitiformis]|eukprot:gene4332-5326_t
METVPDGDVEPCKIQTDAQSLDSLFSECTRRLDEERQALHQSSQALAKERSLLEKEKAEMTSKNINQGDVIELNVGGENFAASRRTLLCAPTDSYFHALFSGRWEESLSRDSQGRVFLDINPDIFRVLLSHLRTIAFTDPEKRPYLGKDSTNDREFWGTMKYLGLTDPLLDEVPIIDAYFLRVDGSERAKVTPTAEFISVKNQQQARGHTFVCGAKNLLCNMNSAMWKVRITSKKHWMFIGIIAKPAASNESHLDNTSYGLAGPGQTVKSGKTEATPSWTTDWQTGNTAILTLCLEIGALEIIVFRYDGAETAEYFKIPISNQHLNNSSMKQEWRLHFNLCDPNDSLEIYPTMTKRELEVFDSLRGG